MCFPHAVSIGSPCTCSVEHQQLRSFSNYPFLCFGGSNRILTVNRPGICRTTNWQGDVTGKFSAFSAPELQTYSAVHGLGIPVVVVSEAILYPGLVFFCACLSCRCSAALQDVLRLERNQNNRQTSRFQKYHLTRKMLVRFAQPGSGYIGIKTPPMILIL